MTTRIADGTGVLLQYPGVGVLHIVGTAADMPGDGEIGYAHGCIFQVTDTSGSDTGVYTNVGTRASANFDAIEVAGGATNATTVAGVTPGAGGLLVLDDANVAAIRTTLELGTFATQNIAATPALTMAGNIALGSNYLSGDGGNEGVRFGSNGGLLQFAGTSSSFPALKRSSTQLQVRLADDSNYAPLAAGLITAAGGVAFGEGQDITTGATTGTKVGAATTNKVGFWGATPVVQPTHIADPAGGATIDSEARTAIAAINAMLAATGLTAAA